MGDIRITGVGAELHRKVKVYALENGISMQEVCVRALEGFLSSAAFNGRQGPASRPGAVAFNDVVLNDTAVAASRQHDPKTCQVYRCGICAATRRQQPSHKNA